MTLYVTVVQKSAVHVGRWQFDGNVFHFFGADTRKLGYWKQLVRKKIRYMKRVSTLCRRICHVRHYSTDN